MNILSFCKSVLNICSLCVPFVAYFFVNLQGLLWNLSLVAVTSLMLIRPLKDIFPNGGFVKLMPLRKSLGIFSASIVVSFGLIHYIELGNTFLSTYFSLAYWTFHNNLFWAHLGELTGFILLVTSNRFSVRLLKRNWKRIQRLSYVYFFSGAWYVFSSFEKTYALLFLIIVFDLTVFAFVKKRIPLPEVFHESPPTPKSSLSSEVQNASSIGE